MRLHLHCHELYVSACHHLSDPWCSHLCMSSTPRLQDQTRTSVHDELVQGHSALQNPAWKVQWQKVHEGCFRDKRHRRECSSEGLMTSWISGRLKSQKLRFQTPRSWKCRKDQSSLKCLKFAPKAAPLPSRLEHSPPLTRNPLARAWLGHLAGYSEGLPSTRYMQPPNLTLQLQLFSPHASCLC